MIKNGYLPFLPLAKTHPLYFCHETVNLTVILNFIGVKMTMNCDNDSVVGVFLPVQWIIKYCHLYNSY